MPPAPWHTVSGDCFGPMNEGKYWFVNYCVYTNWADVTEIKDVSVYSIEQSFVKKLGKILRIAKVTNQDKNVLLKVFLRRYRETSHSTTRVAPSLLLIVHNRSSGIPQLSQPHNQKRLDKMHAFVQANHVMATTRMQDEYDKRMSAVRNNMRTGSLVLTKLHKRRKSTPYHLLILKINLYIFTPLGP